MDTLLDTIWEYLAAGFLYVADTFFSFLQHLHFLGPALLIFLLALGTICVTKLLAKVIVTKRYVELEEKFLYWKKIREEAMQFEDREKANRMARNIDQAELNRAYYDYFFEGFMLGIARKIIPIFFMFAFINEYYRTENLTTLFGRGYVLQIPTTSGEPLLVGGVFWYLISLFLGYLLWLITGRIIKKITTSKEKSVSPLPRQINETSC